MSGLRAVWERARPTLGEVTLAVVFHRAVATIEKRSPALHRLGLRVSEGSAIEIDALDPDAVSVESAEAAALVLVEVLKVLHRLTAGMLTPTLHDALCGAGDDAGEREQRRSSSMPSTERPQT